MRTRMTIAGAIRPVPAGRDRILIMDEVDIYPAEDGADPFTLTTKTATDQARRSTMQLREKGKKNREPASMGWDEAQAALAAGTHEVADAESASPEKDRKHGATTEKSSDQIAVDDDLDAMTKPELEAIAKERGVDIAQAKTKAEIVEALRTA